MGLPLAGVEEGLCGDDQPDEGVVGPAYPHHGIDLRFAGAYRHHRRMFWTGEWCAILADRLPARIERPAPVKLIGGHAEHRFGARIRGDDLPLGCLEDDPFV